MVLFPTEFKISRSLRKTLRSGRYTTRVDHDFGATIRQCAAPRRSGPETWLNEDMIGAYERMFDLGFGHSVETYRGEDLVGGLYGIHLGGVFFGESMFSLEADASKAALAGLVARSETLGIELIDCQLPSAHLRSLGSRPIPRSAFLAFLADHAQPP